MENNKSIEILVENYKKTNDGKSHNELTMGFSELSRKVFDHFNSTAPGDFKIPNEEEAFEEAVEICFDKMDRFDASKVKAFNFFATAIVCHWRQMYRQKWGQKQKKVRE